MEIILQEKMAEFDAKAEDLAARIDSLSYDFDYYNYVDAVDDREAQVQQNRESLLENGKAKDAIVDFLQEIMEDGGECSLEAADLISEIMAFSELASALKPKEAAPEPVPALQENGLYRYYSTQRPVDLGTYPKPPDNKPAEIHNFDKRIPVEGESMQAWGYLEYPKPLTEKQMSDYELRPAPARLTLEQVQALKEKPDIEVAKADISSPEPDIPAGKPDIDQPDNPPAPSSKKSVLQDLSSQKSKTEKQKPRELKASRKSHKPKEEIR